MECEIVTEKDVTTTVARSKRRDGTSEVSTAVLSPPRLRAPGFRPSPKAGPCLIIRALRTCYAESCRVPSPSNSRWSPRQCLRV